MSDFFNDPEVPRRPIPVRPESRRPRPLVLTLVVMAVLLIGFSLFAGIWTDKLWFSSIGYGEVFSTLLWTRIIMFLVFGLAMGAVVGGNLWIAYRLRPTYRANSAEQALARHAHCVLTANVGLPHRSTREAIALAIHLVVHIDRWEGRRVVREVLAVEGYDHHTDRYTLVPFPSVATTVRGGAA